MSVKRCQWCKAPLPPDRLAVCSKVCNERIHNRGLRDGGGRIWTREAVIDAIRDFHDEHGRVPTAGELGAGNKDAVRGERVDWLPRYQTLIHRFGSAREAMRAAGFEPNEVGYYARPSQVIRRAR